MWKATEEFGVGRGFGTKWGMNCTFIVARYKPTRGTTLTDEAAFKENVERGTFDPIAYNCSAVDCQSLAEAQRQAAASQQDYQRSKNVPDQSQSIQYQNEDQNEPQRLNTFNKESFRGLSNSASYQSSHDYITVPPYNAKQLQASQRGYEVNQYTRKQSMQQYLSRVINKDRPRSLINRADTPQNLIIKAL